MPDPAALPWINSHGELAHPDAPRGGGGPGVARIPRPLGMGAGPNPLAIPSPDSGAGRHITPIQLNDKIGDGAPKTPEEIEKEKQQANRNLAIYVVQTSEELIGTASVGRKECFDLLDKVLKDLGGKSANDFERVTGRRDQDYKWGELEPDHSKIRPGDLLQFRDFVTSSLKSGDDTPATNVRGPQHSSIVLAVNADGTLDVAEQHVIDPTSRTPSPVIRRNRLEFKPRKFTLPNGATVTVTVSGTMWVYHPVAKPKDNKVKPPK